jgi:hypothetical protein
MFVRGISLSLITVIATGMFGAVAGAEQRKTATPQPEASSSGPPILRHIPGLRILFGEDPSTDEQPASRSGKADNFDESYYEPQPAQPQKPPKKTALTPEKTGNASNAPSDNSGASGSAPKAASTEKTSATAPKPAATGLSCEKAAAVVSGYGFSDIAPESCSGKIYAFNAKRDGKSFAIKVSAASGELSEVKKLP